MNFFEGIIKLFSTSKYMEAMFEGLKTTLLISTLAAVLGHMLGTLVALVSIAKGGKWMNIPKALCKIYITIIRGTPMALQLFIMFYVIFTFRGGFRSKSALAIQAAAKVFPLPGFPQNSRPRFS